MYCELYVNIIISYDVVAIVIKVNKIRINNISY